MLADVWTPTHMHRQRGPEYRVRWAGSDGSDDEWFSAQAVNQDYPDLLFEFENRTGWHPDDKGIFPSAESSFSFIAATATATAPELCEPSSTKKSLPQYSWKSTSQPPPKMTKKELDVEAYEQWFELICSALDLIKHKSKIRN